MRTIIRISALILVSVIITGIFAGSGFDARAMADDESELFAAIESHNSEAFEELLSRGVNIEARSPNNCTPLMYAAATNNVVAAKTLLDRGAEVDAKGFTSRDGTANSTALILAAETGSLEIAELLIQKGADVNYINSFNRTALFWAYKANKPDMITLLESKGATKEGKISDVKDSGDSKTGSENKGAALAKPSVKNDPVTAASAARIMACCSNMKTIEGACELYLMDNEDPKDKLTILELIKNKYLKKEPKCPLNKNSSYFLEVKGYKIVIKCPEHNKTLEEMIKTVDNLKKTNMLPDINNSSAAPAPSAPDAKKNATLKLFLEVFNKCTHDAAVTVQTTSNETKPPTRLTQYFYYRDPSNFRSDTHAAAQKVRMVISSAGSWFYSENDAKMTVIPPEKSAEIIAAMDIGSIVSKNIDLFELKESKDKKNNILIYILNKKTGFVSTYVIDGKLKVFKRLCTYPKKGIVGEDSVYGSYRFAKIEDKTFAVPKPKTGAAK